MTDLSREHVTQLQESGIPDDFIRARGYRTISAEFAKEDLAPLGYSKAAQVAGLLIPIWDVTGQRVGSMLRMDSTKPKDKYRFPAGTRRCLDVHPHVRGNLKDPSRELWIVEGVKKGDCLSSRGVVTVALPGGVSGFRGRNSEGGITALADWEDVALNERVVHICYDSDVVRKPLVYAQLVRLVKFLRKRRATVNVVLLPEDDEKKVGPDDYIVVLGNSIEELGDLSRPAEEVLPELKALHSPKAAKKKLSPIPPHQHIPTPLGALLDATVQFVAKYVRLASDHYYWTAALWVAHTWVYERFDCTPYLDVHSPMMRSGKTRFSVDVLGLLVRNPVPSAAATEAALFRKIAQGYCTIIYDEVDATFKKQELKESLRAILNAGNRKGGAVLRCEGKEHDVVEFPVYCPKLLAGIGRHLPETVRDRAIPVPLKRKLKTEKVDRFIIKTAKQEAQPLHDAFATWAESDLSALDAFVPESVTQVSDRIEEAWHVLLAISRAAGGPWPERVRKAMLQIHAGAEDDGEDVATIWTIHDIFVGRKTDALHSEDLIRDLVENENGPWARWWSQQVHSDNLLAPSADLAKRLRPLGIRPEQMKIGNKNRRGYRLGDFADALARYPRTASSAPPVQTATTATSLDNQGSAGRFGTATESCGSGLEIALEPVLNRESSGGSGLEQGGAENVHEVAAPDPLPAGWAGEK